MPEPNSSVCTHMELDSIEVSAADVLGSALFPPWLAKEWIARTRPGQPPRRNWLTAGSGRDYEHISKAHFNRSTVHDKGTQMGKTNEVVDRNQKRLVTCYPAFPTKSTAEEKMIWAATL